MSGPYPIVFRISTLIRACCLILVLLYSARVLAQPETKGETITDIPYKIVDGDTILVIEVRPDPSTLQGRVLDSLEKEEADKWKYVLSGVRKTYPLACILRDTIQLLEERLALTTDKSIKKILRNHMQEMLVKTYAPDIKQFSQRQAQFLIKFIHRQCGKTAGDLMSEYLGTIDNFKFKQAASIGGLDLSDKWIPTNELEQRLQEALYLIGYEEMPTN